MWSTSSSDGSRPTSMPDPIFVSSPSRASALTDNQHDVPRPHAETPVLVATGRRDPTGPVYEVFQIL